MKLSSIFARLLSANGSNRRPTNRRMVIALLEVMVLSLVADLHHLLALTTAYTVASYQTGRRGLMYSQHQKKNQNQLQQLEQGGGRFDITTTSSLGYHTLVPVVSFHHPMNTKTRTALFAVPKYGPSSSMNPSSSAASASSSEQGSRGNKNGNEMGINQTNGANNNDDDDDIKVYRDIIQQKQTRFRFLVEQCMMTTEPEHVPRLLGNNIDLIMSLHSEDGIQVISNILDEAKLVEDGEQQTNNNDDNNNTGLLYTHTLQTIETILSFAEDFVQQAKDMDERNKHLLGKIIKTMAKRQQPHHHHHHDNHHRDINDGKDDSIDGTLLLDSTTATVGDDTTVEEQAQLNDEWMYLVSTAAQREESLDTILEQEKDNFTPGFLRHLEGECDRIMNAPTMTPDSARLLELIRMIQTRVLEELGKDMGEATLVLGQLMGYDNEQELVGVLDAGLAVRGIDFAIEMRNLTQEALMGFQRVHGGVEQELIDRVTLIDTRLRTFVEESEKSMNAFQ